jgi:hypothetical protein
MTLSGVCRSRTIRRAASSLLLGLCASIFPVGCGESETGRTNIPADFAAKLEQEHPELFVKKSGKNKTEVVAGRDKKDIIRREWLKAQGSGD